MDGEVVLYRDFMKIYRGFCWTLALSWPLHATLNLWYICSLHRLKNPLSLLIKLRYLMIVPLIMAIISVMFIVGYALGIFYGTIWNSTEAMRLVTVSVLTAQGVVSFMGVIAMITIHPGTKCARRWNPCCCGSCPLTAGEEVAPGIPNPVSLEGCIKFAKVAEKVNKVVDIGDNIGDAIEVLAE